MGRQARHYLRELNVKYKEASAEERQRLADNLQTFLNYMEGEGLFQDKTN